MTLEELGAGIASRAPSVAAHRCNAKSRSRLMPAAMRLLAACGAADNFVGEHRYDRHAAGVVKFRQTRGF
jgi:hypothetical protein